MALDPRRVDPGTDADHLEARGHRARLLDARAHDYGGPFDGVYASAVLLHLSPEQLEQALLTARRATHPGGVLAVTLKEGNGSGWSTAKLDRVRHFTCWRAGALAEALHRTGWSVDTIEHHDGRVEPWLFVLARAGT